MTFRHLLAALAASLLLVLSLTAKLWAQDEAPVGDVVSIGGSITEIIYELGEQDRLLARDSTSVYPSEVFALPSVGYVRALSPEGVLSMGGDLILVEEGAGPPETLDVLTAADVNLIFVPEGFNADAILTKVDVIGEALGVEARADALKAKLAAELETAEHRAAEHAHETPKKVMFILSAQDGRLMVSGEDTSADGIITMAGGVNAFTGYTGYKLVNEEAIIEAAPDVILMMDRTGDHAIADHVLFNMPAITNTPAGANQDIIRIDGMMLLGFGPRTASAVTVLNTALYGE